MDLGLSRSHRRWVPIHDFSFGAISRAAPGLTLVANRASKPLGIFTLLRIRGDGAGAKPAAQSS